MKIVGLLLLAAAAVTALPSDQPATTEEAPILVQGSVSYYPSVAHKEAKATIDNLLQQGQDENACKKLADATLDDTTKSVEAQQKAIDEMDKGADCDKDGQKIKDDADGVKAEADKAVKDAEDALATANKCQVDMGTHDFDSLNPSDCSGLFGQQSYKDCKAKFDDATTKLSEAKGAQSTAAKGVENAEQGAKDAVTTCHCKVRKEQADAIEKMNDESLEANTKAWTKAKHMQCVLDGTAIADCDVGTVPKVKASSFADGVADAYCAGLPFTATLGQRGNTPSWTYSFRTAYTCASHNNGASDCSGTYSSQMETACKAAGNYKPYCDHPSYCQWDTNYGGRSIYDGHSNHASPQSHLDVASWWPSGFEPVKAALTGTCVYTGAANGNYALCNNMPASTGHSWNLPYQKKPTNQITENGAEYYNIFVCGKVIFPEFSGDLAARGGVAAASYAFQAVSTLDYSGTSYKDVMIAECEKIGMKPVCNHPSYCKNDAKSLYLGQDGHMSHYWNQGLPGGSDKTFASEAGKTDGIAYKVSKLAGLCTYCGSANGVNSHLCNYGWNSHAWRTKFQMSNFLCGKKTS